MRRTVFILADPDLCTINILTDSLDFLSRLQVWRGKNQSHCQPCVNSDIWVTFSTEHWYGSFKPICFCSSKRGDPSNLAPPKCRLELPVGCRKQCYWKYISGGVHRDSICFYFHDVGEDSQLSLGGRWHCSPALVFINCPVLSSRWQSLASLFQPLVDSVDPARYIFFSPAVVSLTLPWVPSSAAEAIGKPLEDLNGLTCLGWQEMQTTSQLMQSLHDSCKLLWLVTFHEVRFCHASQSPMHAGHKAVVSVLGLLSRPLSQIR